MNSTLLSILVSLLACCGIMVLIWLWAKRIKNAGLVDVFWSLNFPVIAIIVFIFSDGDLVRKGVLLGIFAISTLRLGLHLWQRVMGHLDEEEGRYQQLRKEWAPDPEIKFFWFFQMQAVSNVLLAIPFFIVGANKDLPFNVLEYIGIIVWIIAFIAEMIADRQLAAFKKDPANKGKVCNTGLWYYSRHPNYFFEWLSWMAYFIFALASPLGWLAIISPAIILYLLLKVTGVPNNEEQNLRSKPEAYKAYQKTTSAFVPWKKK